jgi:hypothetical protein
MLALETQLVVPTCDLPGVDREALAKGVRLFVVCGGDGTLGIISIGTLNNTAVSLGIPADTPAAIATLRMGRHNKVDIGLATCCKIITPELQFNEAALA